MTIIKNIKKDSNKKHAENMKTPLEKKKIKGEKRLEKDIKILLKKKKKKSFSVIVHVKESF